MPQPPAVGSAAPDFTLPNTANEPTSLSAQRGSPVVLLFFPLAFTGVCTTEMCTFRDALSEFNDLNARVYGISVDSPFSLKAFAEKNGIQFPLLSDFNKKASASYGVLREDLIGLQGVANRSAFVIDRDGVIRWEWVTPDPKVEPDYEEIKRQVRALAS
jgi:peroxiredoxin